MDSPKKSEQTPGLRIYTQIDTDGTILIRIGDFVGTLRPDNQFPSTFGADGVPIGADGARFLDRYSVDRVRRRSVLSEEQESMLSELKLSMLSNYTNNEDKLNRKKSKIAELSVELSKLFSEFCHTEQEKYDIVKLIITGTGSLTDLFNKIDNISENFKPKKSDKNTEKIRLPAVAPELWENRASSPNRPSGKIENSVEFIKRVYKEWLGKGISRTTIRHLDPPLYAAYAAHLHNHKGDAIPGLPSRSELVNQKITAIGEEQVDAVLSVANAVSLRRRRGAKPADM